MDLAIPPVLDDDAVRQLLAKPPSPSRGSAASQNTKPRQGFEEHLAGLSHANHPFTDRLDSRGCQNNEISVPPFQCPKN
jgi:hypothetical protein